MTEIRTTLPPQQKFISITPNRKLSLYWDIAKVYYGKILAPASHESPDGRSLTWNVPGKIITNDADTRNIDQAQYLLEEANQQCDQALFTIEDILKNRQAHNGLYSCTPEEYAKFQGLMPLQPGQAANAPEIHIPARPLRDVYTIQKELRDSLDPNRLDFRQVIQTDKGPYIIGWGTTSFNWNLEVLEPVAPEKFDTVGPGRTKTDKVIVPPRKKRRWPWLLLLLLLLLALAAFLIWWFYFRKTPMPYQAYDTTIGAETFQVVGFLELPEFPDSPVFDEDQIDWIARDLYRPYRVYDSTVGNEAPEALEFAGSGLEILFPTEPTVTAATVPYQSYDTTFGNEAFSFFLDPGRTERDWTDPRNYDDLLGTAAPIGPIGPTLPDIELLGLAQGFRVVALPPSNPLSPAPRQWQNIEPIEEIYLRQATAENGQPLIDILLPPLSVMPVTAELSDGRQFAITRGDQNVICRIQGTGSRFFYFLGVELSEYEQLAQDQIQMEFLDAQTEQPLPGWQHTNEPIVLTRDDPERGLRERYFYVYYISQDDIAQFAGRELKIRLSNRMGQQVDVIAVILRPATADL
ncbi:MAG: hypothetical protein JW936_02950 [Sedimentisphaerales bacterium]|nr:hypothetical protein [Sedimentisphaerales bacterium]